MILSRYHPAGISLILKSPFQYLLHSLRLIVGQGGNFEDMVKKVVLGLIILAGILITYNLITQIKGAVKSGERLSQSADTVFALEAKNKALKRKLAQIQSPEFIEEEIRNKLGLAKKGETVIVIPEDKLKLVLGASQSAQIRLPNWLGWIRVFWR